MTRKQYENTLSRKSKQLAKVALTSDNHVMLTLTSKDFMSYATFQSEVKKFILNFRYMFKDMEYINAIECNQNDNHFHSHLIVIFNGTAPKMNYE